MFAPKLMNLQINMQMVLKMRQVLSQTKRSFYACVHVVYGRKLLGYQQFNVCPSVRLMVIQADGIQGLPCVYPVLSTLYPSVYACTL